MAIKHFGGHEVSVICQTTVTLGCRKHKHQVTILVQKGNPLEVLLGTDLLRKLGFNISKVEEDGQVTNLYEEKQDGVVISVEPSTESLSSSSGKNEDESPVLESSNQFSLSGVTVRVLNAVRIPGWHCRMILAHVDQELGTVDTLENDT